MQSILILFIKQSFFSTCNIDLSTSLVWSKLKPMRIIFWDNVYRYRFCISFFFLLFFISFHFLVSFYRMKSFLTNLCPPPTHPPTHAHITHPAFWKKKFLSINDKNYIMLTLYKFNRLLIFTTCSLWHLNANFNLLEIMTHQYTAYVLNNDKRKITLFW